MKAKNEKEKNQIKLRFAVTIWKLLNNSSYESAREFALDNDMEPAHIQKLIREPKDLTLITIVSLKDGLNISMESLGLTYDSLTDDDYKNYSNYLKEQKKKSNLK